MSKVETGSLIYDETGRAALRFGAVRVETSFNPVFRIGRGVLTPEFVTADTVVLSDGALEAAGRILAGSRIVPALHRANLSLRDPEALGFMESHQRGQRATSASIDSLIHAGETAGIPQDRLLLEIDPVPGGNLKPLLQKAAAAGIRLVVELGGGARLDRLGELPRNGMMLRLSGAWAGWFDTVASSRRMFRGAIETWLEGGNEVLLTSVNTSGELQAAIDTGVTHLQGSFLAEPVVAGRITDWRPLNVASMTGSAKNVVTLRRR